MGRTRFSGPIRSTAGFEVVDGTSIINSAGKYVGDVTGDTYLGSHQLVSTSKTIVFDAIGAAGVYVGDILLPAHNLIENITVHSVAAVNAGDSAVLEVGDLTDAATPVAIDEDGFFNDIDVKTDLAVGESVDFYRTAAKHGAYLAYTTNGQNAASKVNKRYSAAARIIRGKLTTVGTASSTGKILMTVVYSVVDADSASFTAT